MTLSQKELDLVEKLKQFSVENGRKPTRDEFRKYADHPTTRFGSLTFNQLLDLAGLPLHPNQRLAKIDPCKPKILFIDIETAPLRLWSYGIRDQYHTPDAIETDLSVLSFAAKWADSEEIIYHSVDPADPRNDESLVREAYFLMNQADYICAHNASFDTKILRGRWLKYEFLRERPFQVICTLRVARKHFKLTSMKLSYLAKYLGVIEKLEHDKYPGMSLFVECSKGNLDAFKHLEDYNTRDVLTLEAVYLKLRRYDDSIRFSIFEQENTCSCGSTEMRKIEPIATKTNIFESYQCVDCGKVFRGDGLLSSILRKHLLK